MSSDFPMDRSLLEHTEWTRSLAARLVADPEQADELSQDTLLVALERPPRREWDLRRWLGTVMGNLLRQKNRRETRRKERERKWARAEAQPSVLDTLERASIHRELVDVLMQVEEPFRTTLVLRFFEALPPRDVARRLGTPVNTVRSRVRRGLDQMRTQLDRRHGKRGAWVPSLLPMLRRGGVSGGLLTGIALMNLKTKLVVAAVALSAGILWALLPSLLPTAEPVPSTGTQADATPLSGTVAEETPLESATPVRTAIPPPLPDQAGSSALPMRGRVIGVDARPLAGVRVAFHPEGRTREAHHGALSDLDGGFEISATPENGTFLVDEPGFVTLFSGRYRPEGQIEPVVVAAPSRSLNAVVLDEDGGPLAGARTQVHIGESFDARFTQVLESSRARRVYGISDGLGRVSLPETPMFDGAELLTSLSGFRTDRRELSTTTGDGLRIVLFRETGAESTLRGVVLDSDGAAVPDAYVALDDLATRSEDDGTFHFDLTGAPNATRLHAVYEGSLPGELSRLPGQEWPDFVTLLLGAPTETIEGIVVTPSGTPQAGVVVWVSDPTRFGIVGSVPVQVENLLAGSMTQQQLDDYVESQPSGFDRAGFLARTPSAFWTYTETDSGGRFTLEGLLPRSYRLSALRRETLEMIETGPIVAGTRGVRIEFGPGDVHQNVAGRVLDRAGAPLAGIDITYSRSVFSVRNPEDPPGRYAAAYDATIDPVQTDELGRFHLPAVPTGLPLLFHGESIIPTNLDLEQAIDTGDLEVVVPLRVHVRVELFDPPRADAFAFLDANGEAVALQQIRVGRRRVMMRATLTDGHSQILSTEDGPFTLVLYRANREVERHPVHLRPGETNVLRF